MWYATVGAHFDGPTAEGSGRIAHEANRGCLRTLKLVVHTSTLQRAEAASLLVYSRLKEGNSSGWPHFDPPTRNGSYHGSLCGMRLSAPSTLAEESCCAVPRLASASSVFLALDI